MTPHYSACIWLQGAQQAVALVCECSVDALEQELWAVFNAGLQGAVLSTPPPPSSKEPLPGGIYWQVCTYTYMRLWIEYINVGHDTRGKLV